MSTVSKEQAVALAETFLAGKRARGTYGHVTGVTHMPPSSIHESSGTFHVEFAYTGAPVRKGAVPPRDHPTVVLVNDRTGECKVMLWL
jgi:hypothetical protein